jgi:hypothetical protein
MSRATLLLMLAALFVSGPVYGQVGLGVRVGTNGPGIELTAPIGNTLNARLGVNFLPVNHLGFLTQDDVTVAYRAEARVRSASLLIDWHLFEGSFRLSTGAMYNGSSVGLVVEPTDEVKAGNRTFTTDMIGRIDGTLDYPNKLVPYLGFGFGNAVSRNKRIGMVLDLGAIFSGAPQFVARGDGMIAPTAQQDTVVTEALRSFNVYPVVSLGMTLRL